MLEKLLYEIRSRELAQASLAELVRINKTLHSSLKANWAGIFVIDFEKELARAIVFEGKEKPKNCMFSDRNTNNISAMAVGDIDAVIIPDIAKSQTGMHAECFDKTKSALLVPIANIQTGERIGIINVQSAKKEAFVPQELFLTQEIAFHIALLIEHMAG